MYRKIAYAVAAGALLSATAANAWSNPPFSRTCSDGYSQVSMFYPQMIGSQCRVLMPGGWTFFGLTVFGPY